MVAAVAVAAPLATSVRGAFPPFEYTESGLAPDPALVFGELPNGVRYVVAANAHPKGKASLRLVVGTGSLGEKDEERGLAHFLEHMAFKGSTHYAPGTLIERLQRLGMGFGADTNAFTSFDRTQYLLELPDTKAETLREGLVIFSDYAGGLLLRQDQIDGERGVILSEKRDRDSVDYRTSVAETKFTLPDSLISRRMPIGEVAVIEKAERSRFLDFYNAWYRPDNIAVVAVGDFDPDQVEGLIQEVFGGLAPRAPGRPEPNLGAVAAPTGVHVGFFPDKEASAVTVEIAAVAACPHEPDTAELRLKRLKTALALAMLNRRLEALSRRDGAPFTAARAYAEEEFGFFREAGLKLTCKPENWQKALSLGRQLMARVLSRGFEAGELAEATAGVSNRINQAAKGASTRLSSTVANQAADSIIKRTVPTSPEQDVAIIEPALGSVTCDECLAGLREIWPATGWNVVVSGNLTLDHPEAAIRSAYEATLAVELEPPARERVEKFPYGDFGPAATVVSEKRFDDLGIVEIVLSNGVRLNLKQTSFESNRIHVNVRVGAGLLTAPVACPGIGQLAAGAFMSGGLGKIGIDDLHRVLAGQPVGAVFKVTEDAFSFEGATDREHLLLEMQFIAAHLSDPGYQPESLRMARNATVQAYQKLAHSTDGPVRTVITRLMINGDPRFGLPAEADLLARDLAEVKAWLSPQFDHGPIEIAIVGDLDAKAAVDAVARTFGALKRREPKPGYDAERKVSFPPVPIERLFTVPTEIDRGLVLVIWPTTDWRNAAVGRRFGLLASVFSDRLRMKIRNEAGAAYSPNAQSSGSTVFPGYGLFAARVSVDPAMAAKVSQDVLSIAADLAKGGLTSDELDRAKNPAVAAAKKSMATNQYWITSVLAEAQEAPERLESARTRVHDIESVTKADLDALAARYLDPARASKFIIVPGESSP